jgi:hypothetical protein
MYEKSPKSTSSVLNLIFSCPNIAVYQHSETNVMHFLFILLKIKGLYIFRELIAHLQEALHKRHLVYCLRVMSVCCIRIGVELNWFHYTDKVNNV